METIRVWTKQHSSVLAELEETGRYIAKQEYICMDLEEHADLVLEVYDWLVNHTPNRQYKPVDAQYPIWVSLEEEKTMLLTEDTVILELEIEKELLTLIHINKWGTMLNYSYIPLNEEDEKAHKSRLKAYGVSDTLAYMSRFYPQIKREIIESWNRLFDDTITLNSDAYYGNIWEIKREWIRKITQ